MQTCVVYFSRTGNTKRLAEAIAEATNASTINISSAQPSAVQNIDLLILGTPVEGFRPAKETKAFVENIPQTEDKKAILFCTYALFKGSTFGSLEKTLSKKGYRTILKVSKKGMKPEQPADFTDVLSKIKQKLS
ncbi:MAG: hypothetical protein NWF00_08695 [Candidatus Bathyarchaeota archaeon]|nr:hypothetical protein [Candidatus Bathyarchaeota archaeon]